MYPPAATVAPLTAWTLIYTWLRISHKPSGAVRSCDLAKQVQHSNNVFVIINLRGLPWLVTTLDEGVEALKLLTVLIHHCSHHVPNRHHALHSRLLHHRNVPNTVICKPPELFWRCYKLRLIKSSKYFNKFTFEDDSKMEIQSNFIIIRMMYMSITDPTLQCGNWADE